MQLSEIKPRLNSPIPYKGRTNDYFCFCPCEDHADGSKNGRRSLRVQEKDGKILLYCFAGCQAENIVKALGLSMSDLFIEDKPKASGRQIVAVYDYHNESGSLIYQVAKYHPKDFRQRRPDGQGGWLWNMQDIQALPYKLPELLKALAAGKVVFIAEGEKDVDSLAALGLTATCNHGGAGKWREHHSKYFPAGANVVILPDNDKPGRDHAEQVRVQLTARGCGVKILNLPGLPDKGDISDWIAAGGTREALIELVLAPPQVEPETIVKEASKNNKLAEGYTAAGIMATDFPDPRWIVPGVICEGLVIFAGPPKIGKSWWCLALGCGVAAGGYALGKVKVDSAEVLYLALEDTPRRLKKRLTMILQGEQAPYGFHIYTRWEKLDQGGLELLDNWVTEHTECKLVIIDTLGKIRGKMSKNGNIYQEDYGTLDGLKKLADDRGLSILLVHHLRKMAAEDPLDTLSGSTGITGAADSILILKRARGAASASLFVTGRDVDEQDLALSFDKTTGAWTILGDAAEYRMTQERRAVVDAMKTLGQPSTPKEIAETMGKNINAVKSLLRKLSIDGPITKVGHGTYTLNSNSFSGTDDTDDTDGTDGTDDTDGRKGAENMQSVPVKKERHRSINPGAQAGQGIQENGVIGVIGAGNDKNDDCGDDFGSNSPVNAWNGVQKFQLLLI